MKILQNQYELTNHLGNVQATVLDRTTPILNNDTLVTGYNSDISLAHDYYPFGMLMPGRYVSDTGRKCVTINTSILVPVIVRVYLWQTEGVGHRNGGISTPPVHQLPVALVAADEKPYVYHYNDASTHPNGEVITGQTVEGNAEYTISLSEEPSGGVTTYFQVHADTNQTDQEIGFDLTLPGDCYVDMRVRQYYTGTGEEYYDAVTWTQVDMSGAQQVLVPIDKTSVAAGGKTILELRFNTTTAAEFPGGVGGVMRNFYYKITHYEPKTHIAIVCDEKDNYRFGAQTQEKVNEVAGIGNHYTALFWEYDSRTGRRWNRDPRPNKSISPYAVFNGNPIRFSDPLGDSVSVKGLYERDANGNLKNYDKVRAFETFASTTEGNAFILSYAEKGFSLQGEIVKGLNIQAEEEGINSARGVDLIYSFHDGESNYTSPSLLEGRLKINIGMKRDVWSTMRPDIFKPGSFSEGVREVESFSHESFLHADLQTRRYIGNRNFFNNPNPNLHFDSRLDIIKGGYDHDDAIYNKSNSLHYRQGLNLLKDAQIKLLNSDFKGSSPISDEGLQDFMRSGRTGEFKKSH
ncbi:hypothetical protein [Algoriphagus sp. Y33]|uniref:hypothetical protein n=1 Tax=Algoriphagus sp. Y33 TaxID=2772483 RepID=UPI00178657BC|nr:hypothetical protein [Algoriphagus sp. Y33]